ncbi:MAG TPA: GNAT family N-acetyltransferase [Ktedonobacteraceae bacterium]|jgi:dTDP-4-amino-4,6-dideoxy-D-galactose acyltransferase
MKESMHHTSASGSFSWKQDAFDSQILALPVAKVTDFQPAANQHTRLADELTLSLRDHDAGYALYRCPAQHFQTVHALERNHWRLVDGSIHLDLELTERLFGVPASIRRATAADVPQLQTIARQSFTFNRYYTDPLIPRAAADEIYAQWIKNSIDHHFADAVFVSADQEKLSGFATLKKDGDVVLVAVTPQHQGRLLGRQLVARALNECIQWNLARATIETQLTNLPALRCFQSLGFKIKATFLTLRWARAEI